MPLADRKADVALIALNNFALAQPEMFSDFVAFLTSDRHGTFTLARNENAIYDACWEVHSRRNGPIGRKLGT